MDLRRGAAWFGVLGLVVLAANAVLLLEPSTVNYLITEDGWFENIGAAGLALAGLFFGLAFWRAREEDEARLKQLSLLVLAIVFFFGAGEEISWGQRIFGWEATNDAINRQNETNIHNLRVVYDDAAIRPYRLFTVPFFTFVFAVPLLCWAFEPARRFFGRLIPLVPWTLGAVFLFNDLFSKVPEALIANDVIQMHSNNRVEVREMAFSVMCAATAFYVFRYLPGSDPGTRPDAEAHIEELARPASADPGHAAGAERELVAAGRS